MLARFTHRLTCLLSAFLLTLTAMAQPAAATSIIRDAEVEHTLRLFTDPILNAADIQPSSVRLFIINDPSVNAFVTGGLNIFIHTGLILNTDEPGMLIGVIAHEVGHISGAHLSQLSAASEQASLGALLSYVLGAAATLGGAGDVGGAIMTAGQNTAMRNLLSHYRGNEQQADQAAIRFMREANLPAHGMLDMFQLMRRNEQQSIGQPDPYLRTHPLTTDRIAAMRSAVGESQLKASDMPPEYLRWHDRMVAKLYAFLESPEKTRARYPDTNKTEAAYLARAVAWFKASQVDNALREADALIALSPDAFAYDLKGQILYENGRIDESITAYLKAAEQGEDSGIILTDLGKAYLAKEDTTLLPKAVVALEKAARADDTNAQTFRNLAIAYGKQGKMGESNLALAREASLRNQPEETLRYAKQAKSLLPADSHHMLQVEDMIAEARQVLKDEKEN